MGINYYTSRSCWKETNSIFGYWFYKVDSSILQTLEGILYGSEGVNPRLPLPDEISELFGGSAPSALVLSTTVPADAATAILLVQVLLWHLM